MIQYTTIHLNKVIFVNQLEFLKLYRIDCFCFGDFNYVNAINILSEKDIEQYVKASIERLSDQVKNFCMECETNILKENIQKTLKTKSFLVKITDSNEETTTPNHIICNNCFKIQKAKMNEDNKQISTLHCHLCEAMHNIDPQLWENKAEKGKKCTCDCVII